MKTISPDGKLTRVIRRDGTDHVRPSTKRDFRDLRNTSITDVLRDIAAIHKAAMSGQVNR